MPRRPPHERPTANELANGDDRPAYLDGQPAAVCPACGCTMFVYRTTTLDTRIIRYEKCRNCGRRFITRQYRPDKRIIREVDSEDSSPGNASLRLVLKTA